MKIYDNTMSFFAGGIAGGLVEAFGEVAAGHGGGAFLGATLGIAAMVMGYDLTGKSHEDSAAYTSAPYYETKRTPSIVGGVAGALAAWLLAGAITGALASETPTVPNRNVQAVEQTILPAAKPAP